MSRRRAARPRPRAQPVEVRVTLAGIPCVVTGVEIRDPTAAPERRGLRRLWHTIRGSKSGMLFAPEWLGFKGWLDIELRAEAEYRRDPMPLAG